MNDDDNGENEMMICTKYEAESFKKMLKLNVF